MVGEATPWAQKLLMVQPTAGRLLSPTALYLGLQPAFCHSPELPPSLTLESSRFSPFLPLGLVSHHALLCYQIAWLTFL